MMNTLRKKYMVTGSFLILAFLCMLILFSGFLQDRMVERWNHRQMESVSEKAIKELEEQEWDISKVEFDSLAFENNVSISVADQSYNLLSTTRIRESVKGRLGKKVLGILNNNQMKADVSQRYFYSNFSDETNRATFILIDTVKDRGFVIVRKSVTGLKSSINVIWVSYIISACLTFLVGILILIYFSGKLVKPIKEINRITKKIANLDFDEKATVSGKDELAELANSVNQMSDKLNESLRSIRNDAEQRKILVRNMAHELKTPTAVIMGYAENMAYISDKQPEKLPKYCNVISQECERMDGIIKQMLELSSLEEMGTEILKKKNFESQEIMKYIRTRFEGEFPNRNHNYRENNEIQDCIYGDFDVLCRAVYNYIENAVHYGKEDGIIKVHAYEDEKYHHFSVFNQGDGVPEEEQEKIWDVFYKVDSSQNGKKQGYGIGLSIVKQTAIEHNGNVQVRNIEDGVEFEIYIEKR